MGVIISWISSLLKSNRSSDFLVSNDEKREKIITSPPRWCYDFIPGNVSKHLKNNDCKDITKVTDQITQYTKDQEVGNSVMLQFDFNVPLEIEKRIKVRDINDEFLTIFKAVDLEDHVTEKVLQSINWYNVSEKRKYLIRINPLFFAVECFFDKQPKSKKCKYQLTFRIFYNPSKKK